jgi:hypothetical protein
MWAIKSAGRTREREEPFRDHVSHTHVRPHNMPLAASRLTPHASRPPRVCHASRRHDHVITYLNGVPMETYEYTQIARIHRTRRSGRSVNTMTSPFIDQQGMRYSDDNVLSRFVHIDS